MRRHARKLHVFCHGGAMHVPRHGQVLIAHLEPCVVEVAAPRGGVFHPKVWVLRFEPETGSEAPVRFRLLVGTRNLTFDRSWDTQLQLDGEFAEGRGAIARNRPLASFVAAIPGLALHGAPPEAEAAPAELARELLHVEWELPDKVDEIEFLPFGIESTPWPFDRGRQRLVMAPFVDAAFLERFGGERADGVIVSWAESLQNAQAGLGAFAERFVLADGTDGAEGLEVEGAVGDPSDALPAEDEVGDGDRLRGLHAKLFVLDDGHRTHVLTGSANATMAAFERNVEFLVRLDASKWAMGIEMLLGRQEKGALFELLEPWEPAEIEDDPEQAVRRRLEEAVELARRSVGEADLWLELHPIDPEGEHGTGDESGDGDAREEAYRLEVHGAAPVLPGGVRLSVWPVVLPPLAAAALEEGPPLARFDVSLGAATAFLAFELVAREAGLELRLRIARRLRLDGLPGDRELVLPSGLSVRVARNFDEVALRRLLGVVSTC